MADPITLAVVGATAGALINPNDPIKGAAIGGLAGFTGGTALGAGAAGSGLAAGSTVGAGGAGALGQGITATTLGGGVPASAGLGMSAGGTGLMASAPAASSMGLGSGLLGATTGSMATPFAAAATPTMLSTPFTLGGTPMQQAYFANQLLGRGQQQPQQPLPRAPAIQTRPYTGMKLPVNAQEEEMRRRMMYAMPPVPQISLL